MFDTLDDRIKKDDCAERTPAQTWTGRALVAVLSIVLFGPLYIGIRMLE